MPNFADTFTLLMRRPTTTRQREECPASYVLMSTFKIMAPFEWPLVGRFLQQGSYHFSFMLELIFFLLVENNLVTFEINIGTFTAYTKQ